MKKQAKIFHFDSFGKRQEKYDRLNTTEFRDVDWKELELKEPYYFFVPKDFAAEEKYNQGFSVNEIFQQFNSGIQTKNDKLSVQFDKENLEKIVQDFQGLDVESLRRKYDLKDTSGWNVLDAKNDLLSNDIIYTEVLYKPFDVRHTVYTWKSSWFIWRPRDSQSKHMLKTNNALYLMRTLTGTTDLTTVFLGDSFCDINFYGYQTYFFPLYLYPQTKENLLNETAWERVPNFNMEVIQKIEKRLWLELDKHWVLWPQKWNQLWNMLKKVKEKVENSFSPEDLFDYIYAVLHSKIYRDTYKEFLKIDFPRVPFDVDREIFFTLVKRGRELRSYHLMEHESLVPQNFVTTYPMDGDNEVEKVRYEIDSESSSEWQFGKVFINDTQYFEWVPKEVWEFYIWGYQPAQKWLKDRKGRKLTYEDILHYSKIVVCLKETIRIMEEIEEIFKNN